ncbi:MAG TPA: hypothetical protein VHU17_19760, partial [Acidimicrobiales bacterium]|nr:hypothetical protein [Acidimicrobiales bacterium]
ATVVTNAVSAHWVTRTTATLGSVVTTGLELRAVEPLHHVVVTITPRGPASLRQRRSRDVGSLAKGQRSISVSVTAHSQGTGSFDASVTALNADGQTVSDQQDLYFAANTTIVVFSDTSDLGARVTLLNLHRSALGPVAYQERMSALLGGGATVQTIQSPSLTAQAIPSSGAIAELSPRDSSTTTVSGQIQYTDSANKLHPSRNILVEVWDQNLLGSNTLLSTVWADGSGKYSTSVPTYESDGTTPRDIFVQALAEADVDVGVIPVPNDTAAFVIHAPGGTAPLYMDSRYRGSSILPVTYTATGAPIAINMIANNTDVNDTAFDVADALETGMQYTEHLDACGCLKPALSYTTPLSVDFPISGISNYEPTTATLQIAQADQFNWLIILHEYGHVVSNQMGITQSPGGAGHSLFSNDALLYTPPNKLNGMRLAWSEGFATFFSLMAMDFEQAYTLGIPTVEDGIVDIYGYDVNYANSYGTRTTKAMPATDTSPAIPSQVVPINSTGEDNELAVGRALYQFYKKPSISLP